MGPRIDTERLMLRLPEMADAENISRYCGEFDVARMTSRIPHPYPVLAAELWVLQTRAAWRPGGNQSLTVEIDGQAAGGGGVRGAAISGACGGRVGIGVGIGGVVAAEACIALSRRKRSVRERQPRSCR